MTPGAVRCFGEEPEVGECAERGDGGWSCDVETSFDESRRQHRLLEGEVDELVRSAAGRFLDGRAVALAEVGELLGTSDRIDGLCCDRVEEQREPALEVSVLADALQCCVVLVSSFLEVGGDVQDWCREAVANHEEEDDEESAEPTVAVEERMDGLELVVEEGLLDERRQGRLFVDERFEIVEEVAEFIRWWRNEGRGLDRGAGRTDPVLRRAELPGCRCGLEPRRG